MQPTDLKFPGDTPLAQTVRREVARIISQLEIAAEDSTVPTDFAEFLADAAAQTPGYAGPSLPATSTVVYDAQEITLAGSEYTFTVAGGVITAIAVVPV